MHVYIIKKYIKCPFYISYILKDTNTYSPSKNVFVDGMSQDELKKKLKKKYISIVVPIIK